MDAKFREKGRYRKFPMLVGRQMRIEMVKVDNHDWGEIINRWIVPDGFRK